ncbi:MAG: hypothetical protein NVSMB64_30740 [Candidatus Velthaea sp.]
MTSGFASIEAVTKYVPFGITIVYAPLVSVVAVYVSACGTPQAADPPVHEFEASVPAVTTTPARGAFDDRSRTKPDIVEGTGVAVGDAVCTGVALASGPPTVDVQIRRQYEPIASML